jgi:hypothetical protein
MATGLPGPSLTNSTLASLRSTGLPSEPISNSVTPDEPTTRSGGMPYTFSVQGRMNSMPPPDTMKDLNPLARR